MLWRRLKRDTTLGAWGESRDNPEASGSLNSNAIVHVIVHAIERRASAVDNVNEGVNDGVDCREAALITKRRLGDDLV